MVFVSFLGSNAQWLVLRWLFILSMILCISGAQEVLTPGEITALEQLYSNFPSLAVAGSKLIEIRDNRYLGTAWTTNFRSYCDIGEGYQFHGIYCHNGHISGIIVTQEWGVPISNNYPFISGLTYLKNVSIDTTVGGNVDLLLAIVQNLAVENIVGTTLAVTDTMFAYPENVQSLRGRVSLNFNISSFSSLRELGLSDLPDTSVIDTWVWPYDTLEILDLGPSTSTSTNLPISSWLNIFYRFRVLRVLKGVWYSGPNNVPVQAEVSSQTLQTVKITLMDRLPAPVNFTLNCPTCLEVDLTWDASTVSISAPLLQKLTFKATGAWPTLLTPFPSLTDLHFSAWQNVPPVVPDFSFAPSLRSLQYSYSTIDHTNLIQLLCSLPSTLKSLSLATIQILQAIQFPACLMNLTTFSSGGLQKFNASTLILNLPSSLTSLTLSNALYDTTSIAELKKFTQLRAMHISDPNVVGDIPADFFATFPQLSNFYCQCAVTGTIPSVGWNALESFSLSAPVSSWQGIDLAPNLRTLAVTSASLTRLPSDDLFLAAYLQSLLSIDIGDVLTGPVPTFWTSLPTIESVLLSNNQLSGPFYRSICSPRLMTLDLSHNSICGPLPNFTAPPKLSKLILNDNLFSGSIPDSWSVNLRHLTELSLFNNPINGTIAGELIERVVYPDLSNTNLVGPIWNMSRFTPDSISITNSGINICLVDPEIPAGSVINSCAFDNLLSCPSDCPSYWPCTNSITCNRLTSFSPQIIGVCTADLNTAASSECTVLAFPQSPQLTSVGCPLPEPPGFVCVNGQYISNGSVTLEVVTLPSQAGIIVVKGNLSVNGAVIFNGLGSTIEIEGCLDVAPNQVHIDLTSLDDLRATTLINQKGTDCATDLSKIPVILDDPKDGCKKAKVSTSQSTRSSLVVAFTIDSSRCNVKWIILGCVLGGVVILSVVAVVLLYTFNPSFRTFLKERSCKK